MDLKSLTKDKKLLALMGCGAAVGLVVALRRKSAGTASDGTPQATSAGQASGAADTTGTDIASWLSSYGETLISTEQALLNSQATTGTPAVSTGSNPTPAPEPAPAPAPTPAPAPAAAPAPAPAPVYVSVAKWVKGKTPWNSTLSGIAAHEHTSVNALMKLNPSIKNPNLIYAGSKIRVS